MTRRNALVVSGVVAAVCVLTTAVLIDGARESSDLSSIDPTVTNALLGARNPILNTLDLAVTSVGSTVGLSVLTALLALWLGGRQHLWRWAGLVVVAMAGAAAVTVALKVGVGRARPSFSDLISSPSLDPSFPSGHSLNSTVFFGLVLLTLLRVRRASGRPRRMRWWVIGCVAAPALIGVSRVYLGYHWATDVLAGWVVGVGWLALVTVAVATWAWPREDG